MLETTTDYLTTCFTYMKKEKKTALKRFEHRGVLWEVFGAQCDRKLNRTISMRSEELLASSPIPTEGVQDNGHRKRSVAWQQEPTANNLRQECILWLYINPSFQARLNRPRHFVTTAQPLFFSSNPFRFLPQSGPSTTVSHLEPRRSGLVKHTNRLRKRHKPKPPFTHVNQSILAIINITPLVQYHKKMLKFKYSYVPCEFQYLKQKTKTSQHRCSFAWIYSRKLYFHQNCTVIRVSLCLHIHYH